MCRFKVSAKGQASIRMKDKKTNFSCQSECNREYVNCFEYCPCNSQCPAGCSECENAICKEVLILNTFRLRLILPIRDRRTMFVRWSMHYSKEFSYASDDNIPLLVDFAGDVEVIDFTFGEDTEVEASCSTVYQGEQLIIGGWNQRTQVFSSHIDSLLLLPK